MTTERKSAAVCPEYLAEWLHEFEKVQKRVIERLSVQGNGEYLHSIGNLALLNSRDNAALSNSSFDVKNLYWDDGSWTVCENDAFVTYWCDEESEEKVEIPDERIDIKQNADGIDIGNRIEKYRKLCWE